MSFFDQMKDFSAALRQHWRILAALAVLIAFGAIYVEKKLLPSTPPVPTTQEATVPKPGAPEEKKSESEANAPPATAENPVDSVSSQTVEVAARPALVVKGQAKWDDALKTLTENIAKVRAAARKNGITADGRPLTVFTETDDNGFHYEVMLPISKAPDGKPKLDGGVEIGASPGGKAIKFQHRGTYDEIDATYEAITAYLDEKGLDTKNVFVEEYLNDLKEGEDANLEVDIYVFVK